MKKIIVLTIALMFTFVSQSFAYTVIQGDSLWKISVKHQVGIYELIKANPQFKNPDLIYAGQWVNIPTIPEKEFEKRVIVLVNQERAKYGLRAYTENWELSRVARYKSMDMRDNDYFSHNSPTYGSPFTMMRNFGVSYRTAGENIANGQTTPEAVMKSWMNSSGHKANILSKDFTQIGVGYAKGGMYGHYWTQQFISK